jgi:hypothetical protein
LALPPPASAPAPPRPSSGGGGGGGGGGSADTALSASLRAALEAALAAVPGAELVTLSNLYGLPVLRMAAAAAPPQQPQHQPDGRLSDGHLPSAAGPAPAEPIETIFAAAFAVTAEMLEKLSRFGHARGACAVYGEHVVMQVALHPLVLALVARAGPGLDLDLMHATATRLARALAPVRDAADKLLEQQG